MKYFGLLGRHLTHSFSPQIHAMMGDENYKLFESEPEDLKRFFEKREFMGLNVTVPYKEAVIPFLDEITPSAKKIGAVNTVYIKDSKLIGDNTDYYGFLQMLSRCSVSVKGKKVLILGSGGASKMVRTVMSDIGAGEIVTVSRSGENNYSNLSLHYDASVIINTTPVGMYPNNYGCLIDLSDFAECECVLDLIYNPLKTQLILQAEKLGIKFENGLWMLAAQAKRARELFTDSQIDDEVVADIYNKIYHKNRNIVLIGMPGCGKSTAAAILSGITGREAVSIDSLIEKEAGITIPEIFERYGEDHFRVIETKVLKNSSKSLGVIVDCGGGIVTRQENYDIIKQNGFVVFLDRGWDDLPTDGRPISRSSDIHQLYEKRLPLYHAFCDVAIDTCGSSPEETVKKILESLR